MQSAGDLEKFGYCPLSWWLSRDSEIHMRETAEGTMVHDSLSHRLRSFQDQERSVLDWNISFLISIAVLVNLVSVFFIFMPGTSLDVKRFLLLGLSTVWIAVAALFLYRAGTHREVYDNDFHETAVTALSITVMILAFNIVALVLLGSAPEWIYGFFSVMWLIISAMVLFFGRSEEKYFRALQQKLKITDKVEYVGDDRAPVLRSEDSGLSGKPDFILRRSGELIPVELKTGRTPKGPLFSHILQVGAYCIIVSDLYGQRVEKGLIRYPKGEFEIEFDENLEQLVREKVREMESIENSGEAHRNHQRKGKCDHCSRSEGCPEAIR